MNTNNAYSRMMKYKAQFCKSNHTAQSTADEVFKTIKVLSGFKSHSRNHLQKEYQLIRNGDILVDNATYNKSK